MAGSFGVGNLPEKASIENGTVFSQKENIEATDLSVSNPTTESEAKIRKAKADAIDSYFKSKDMPFEGLGMKLVVEAEKDKLDWRLLAAISVRESTGGKNACKKVKNNAFGWGSCKIGFKSNEEAIETVARNLGGNNPNTAKHYSAKSVKGILESYNPPHIVPNYAGQVMDIMDSIGDKNIGLAEVKDEGIAETVATMLHI